MTQEEIRLKIIKREERVKLAVVLAILALFLVILLAIPGMLVSFLIAFVITYLLKPVVSFFERLGLSRTFAILIPFLLCGLIIGVGSSVLVPRITQQATSLQTEMPKYVSGFNGMVKNQSKKYEKLLGQISKGDAADKAAKWAESSASEILSSIPNFITQFFSTLIMAPFFAFFMLRDGKTISRQLLGFVPNNLFEMALNLLYQMNQQLGGFIRARLLEALFVGAFVWLGLIFIGFPYSVVLGILAGVTNLIPYVGPVIGAVPAFIVAMVSQDSTTTLALLAIIYLAAQIFDMLVLVPLVLAKVVDMHPVTVVVVIIVGAQVMGIMGMIISVPVASIIKMTFLEFYNHVVDFQN